MLQPDELEVRQQVVAQERRPPHVGAHVAAGRRGAVEDRGRRRVERVEVDDVHHHDGRDEQRQRRDGDPDDALGRPRRAGPSAPAGARCAGRPARPRRRRGPSAADSLASAVVGGAARRRRRRRRRRRAGGVDHGHRRLVVGVDRPVGSSPGRARSVRSFIATGNDASRRAGSVGHRTASSSPVTLNATWVAIDMPRRPVTSRQAPTTRPNANRPGYSTGRKWMRANQAAATSHADDVVEAGGERALQQAAVDELLDDRRADAHHQHEQHHRRRRWPGRRASRRSRTAGRRRTCPARSRAAGGRRAAPARAG